MFAFTIFFTHFNEQITRQNPRIIFRVLWNNIYFHTRRTFIYAHEAVTLLVFFGLHIVHKQHIYILIPF